MSFNQTSRRTLKEAVAMSDLIERLLGPFPKITVGRYADCVDEVVMLDLTTEAADTIKFQAKRIAELEAEVAALRVDAGRYRYLRDVGATFYTGTNTDKEKEHHVCEWAMDDAIDAAIKEQQ